MDEKLTLRNALVADRLDDFIAQAEANGVGPADVAELDDALRRVIKQPAAERSSSRSPARGGSRGK